MEWVTFTRSAGFYISVFFAILYNNLFIYPSIEPFAQMSWFLQYYSYNNFNWVLHRVIGYIIFMWTEPMKNVPIKCLYVVYKNMFIRTDSPLSYLNYITKRMTSLFTWPPYGSWNNTAIRPSTQLTSPPPTSYISLALTGPSFCQLTLHLDGSHHPSFPFLCVCILYPVSCSLIVTL